MIKIGHDIIAYSMEKVSSLRYGMMNSTDVKQEIYKLLECLEFYNGVSGNGSSRVFEKQEFIDILNSKGFHKKHLEDIIEFIEDCSHYDEVMIRFS